MTEEKVMSIKEQYLEPLIDLAEYAARRLNSADTRGLVKMGVEYILSGARSTVKISAWWIDRDTIHSVLDPEDPAHDALDNMPLHESCSTRAEVDAAILLLEDRTRMAAELLEEYKNAWAALRADVVRQRHL